jgi:4-hydroxy-tetrahydrodipicolinate synthase
MKPFEAKDIRGCWATCLLNITEDDGIDYGFLDQEIAVFQQAGVAGVYSNGTAGEFYTQSRQEFEKINTVLARGCEAAGLPYQIGASHPFPQESLELIKVARDLAPAAIQVILPDWFPINRDATLRYLEKASKTAGNVKLVLYNPPHAKVVLKPEDFLFIAERIHGLAGIKTAGGDDDWYSAMQPVFKKLSVFIPGHFYASGITRGAHGSYSNMACLSPNAAQKWAMTAQDNMPGALELEKRILIFMKKAITPFITEKGFPNQACDKLLAAVGGWGTISSRLRWPYSWIPEDEIPKIRSYGQEIIPEFFCDYE